MEWFLADPLTEDNLLDAWLENFLLRAMRKSAMDELIVATRRYQDLSDQHIAALTYREGIEGLPEGTLVSRFPIYYRRR